MDGVAAERWTDQERYRPDYNAGPGNWMPVIRNGKDGQRELHTMKWGLIPRHTKAGIPLDHFRMFNARSETITESPVFRKLTPSQHCVAIVDGFYEWHQETETRKQPYYISFGKDRVMKFAGLYDCWNDSSTGQVLFTFTMITTGCSPRFKWLHNRMPVILDSDAKEAEWLDPKNSVFPENFYEPYNGVDLVWHPVTKEMGKRTFKGPQCCKDVRQGGIDTFFKTKGPVTQNENESRESGEKSFEESHGATEYLASDKLISKSSPDRFEAIQEKAVTTPQRKPPQPELTTKGQSRSPGSGRKRKEANQSTLAMFFPIKKSKTE